MKIKNMTLDGYELILQDGGKELERTCPKCHNRQPISAFGLRIMSDKKEIRIQAECKSCRGES